MRFRCVRGQAGQAFTFVVEVEDTVCLPVRAAPAPPSGLASGQPGSTRRRVSFVQVKAVATEPASFSQQHALGTAIRDLDLRRDSVRLVEDAWGVTVWDSRNFTAIGEHRLAGGKIGSGCNERRRHRVIQRQDLILGCLHPEPYVADEACRDIGRPRRRTGSNPWSDRRAPT